jgi:hypothetical protein
LFDTVSGLMAFPCIWAPTHDHEFNKDPFFADKPRKVLEEGGFNEVPIMIGLTKNEGLINTAFMLSRPHLHDYFRYNISLYNEGRPGGGVFGPYIYPRKSTVSI